MMMVVCDCDREVRNWPRAAFGTHAHSSPAPLSATLAMWFDTQVNFAILVPTLHTLLHTLVLPPVSNSLLWYT